MESDRSDSSKYGFYTVEKASGNALDMLGHRAQALWLKERSLTHQKLNFDALFSFCYHPACGTAPVLTKQSRFHRTKIKSTQMCGCRCTRSWTRTRYLYILESSPLWNIFVHRKRMVIEFNCSINSQSRLTDEKFGKCL